MPKLTFVVGPIGSGIAEMSAQLALTYRNKDLPNSFDFPLENDAGVLMKYVSSYAQGGIEETRYMYTNNLTFDFESYKTLLKATIDSNASIGRLVLGGTGLTLYISQFKELYPEAEIICVKRVDSNENINQVINHTTTPDMCWCGVEHRPLPTDILSYTESLNSQLLNSVNQLVSNLGATWTSRSTGAINGIESYIHDHYNFMAPVEIVAYRPS